MIESLGFPIIGLLFLILVAIVFFNRKRYKTLENDIFTILLLYTLFISVLGILCTLTMANHLKIPVLNEVLCRIYVLGIIAWMSLILAYLWSLGRNSKYEKTSQILKERYIKSLFVFTIVTYIVSLFYDLTFTSVYNDSVYIIGGEGKFALYSFVVIMVVSILYILLVKKRDIPLSRRLPLFFFVFYLIVVSILQLTIYDFNDLTYLYCLCVIAIYFSIENPDVQLIERLRETNKNAERAFKNRTDFLLEISNEIRTPLNSIVGFSRSIINEENISEEDFRSNIEYINSSSKELLNTIDNIQEISNMEAVDNVVKSEPFLINDLVIDIKQYVKSKLHKNVQFNIDIDKELPKILIGDKEKILKILMRLIGNSIKFTQTGEIELKITGIKKLEYIDIHFVVNDTGVGMSENEFNLLTTYLDKYDVDAEISNNGVGIGLLATKNLVKLLGGEMTFSSNYGIGSTFDVVVKCRICEDEKVVEKILTKGNNNSYVDCSKYNVLLIDTGDISSRANYNLLKTFGFNIDTYKSDLEAIEKIKSGLCYDLLIMGDSDLELSASDTIRKIKKLKNYRIPKVFVGISNDAKYQTVYLNDGFTAFLLSPIDELELMRLINKYFSNVVDGDNNV